MRRDDYLHVNTCCTITYRGIYINESKSSWSKLLPVFDTNEENPIRQPWWDFRRMPPDFANTRLL